MKTAQRKRSMRKDDKKPEARRNRLRIKETEKGTGWMPMALDADERRGKLRKATGSRKQALDP